jgi:hypothetical protein
MGSSSFSGSCRFPASAGAEQSFIYIPQQGSLAPLGFLDRPEHVAAGFMPAFKFEQRIFSRNLNAGIKPAATSIRKLDSFALKLHETDAQPDLLSWVERPPSDVLNPSLDLTLRAPQAAVSSESDASIEHVPTMPRTAEVPARSVTAESVDVTAKQLSVSEVADRVYRLLERRLVIDKERRGIF